MKQQRLKGGPPPGTPSPLRGRPSPLRGRRFPERWRSGQDPDHHRLWRRFLLARNQARYWHQEWSVSWETYRDLMLPHKDQLGRKKHCWNLVRRDRNLPWTNENVMAAQRHTVIADKKSGARSYLPPLELARRRAVMEQYKQRGYKGKRYKRYDRDDEEV